MKVNRLILIGIFLLIIFTISCVNASDNSTDLLTQENTVKTEIELSANDGEVQSEIDEVPIVNNSDDDNHKEIVNDINVTFEKQMWVENLSDIEVSLPQNATGIFIVKLNDEVIYNETITTKKFNVPIKIPENKFPYVIAGIWPPLDGNRYTVSAFYNDCELNISQPLTVMKYSPEYEFRWNIPCEIIQYQQNLFPFIIPRSANGNVEIYIDNKLVNKTKVTGPYIYFDSSIISNLPLGNHTLRFFYENDTYYCSKNESLNFEVVNVMITIPKIVNIGHDDCVSVDVLSNTSGSIKIYVDGVLVKTGKTDKNGGFIESLADYLKYNSSEVKVIFTGKHYNRIKTVKINITYDMEFYGFSDYVYGEDNTIEILLPDNFNNKLLTVTIDGKKFNFIHSEFYMNNIVEMNISKLEFGNHTIFLSYVGDDKFIAKNATYNFTISYRPICPIDVNYNDGKFIYLNLPRDAKGNLTVYINGVFYKTSNLKKGYVAIKVDDLAPNNYEVTMKYTGSDYKVDDSMSSILYVDPKITNEYRLSVGQDEYITVEVPKNVKGYVLFCVNEGKSYKVFIKNGKAKFSLKNLEIGENDISIDYYSGNFSSFNWRTITVYKPKVMIISSKLYTNGVNAKIKILNYENIAIKNVLVLFKINCKNFKVKTNSKGIVTIKSSLKLKSKKYIISVSCNGAKLTRKLTAKHVISLKSTNVKKSAKRLVLTAVLKDTKAIKSKLVIFKFKGKTYKAKTNSKGIAKVTIKKSVLSKLKVGKKITFQATYLKDTVKRSVKVRI